ncbi:MULTISPECIES: hypothetical protein [Sulfitobacter]|uniref:Uncharacterized protein n=1 Tax=Sulfitobacter profundi TaxID=2679961 RepID=A0ABW1Z2V0_9RHOB|nr:hypothetical protein [Sulfitobacter indolifex]
MTDQDKHYEFGKAVNEQVIDNSNIVLRTLLFINGGAAVAMLGFIGSIVGSEGAQQSSDIAGLTLPLIWFGWGIVAVVVAMVFAYFTNYAVVAHSFAMSEGKFDNATKLGTAKMALHCCAALTTIGSLALFIFGLFEVRASVMTLMG